MNGFVESYTDLTEARLEVLRQAARGELKRMNSAMHQAMSELIDHQFQITDYGRKVLHTAEEIIAGIEREGPAIKDILPVKAKKQIQMYTGWSWFTTGHTKLLIQVYCFPGITYRALGRGYGYKTIEDLARQGLISVDRRLGGGTYISIDGLDVLVGSEIVPAEGEE